MRINVNFLITLKEFDLKLENRKSFLIFILTTIEFYAFSYFLNTFN